MKKRSGFTLIELLVAIAVLGVLAAAALPSYRLMIARNRATTDANSLVSLLMTARSEAIKRNAQVVACRSLDGNTCATVSAVGWHDGVIVFVDNVSRDGQRQSAETLIQKILPFSRGATVLGDSNTATRVTYGPSGTLATSSGNGTITVTPAGVSGAENQRRVVISVTGRPKVT